MFTAVDSESQFSWQDYILLHPSISVGTVGQLAVDLILNNIQDAKRIGYFFNNCFVPSVGSDPFGSSQKICTSCEVFESKSTKLIIVQQRSPFIKGRVPTYRRLLIEWVKNCQFKKVVILGSCSAHIQNDADLKKTSQNIMYMLSQDHEPLETSLTKDFNWMKFNHTQIPLEDLQDSPKDLFIPGGGIMKTLFEDCCKHEISTIALLAFSNDGNGTPDAFNIADGFNDILPLASTAKSFKQGSWRIPVSWNRLQSTAVLPQMY